MPLTKEAKAALQLRCCECKYQMAEAWKTLQQIEKIKKVYQHHHTTWANRFQAADRQLAEEDRLTIVTTQSKKTKEIDIILSPDQVRNIAKALGIDVNKL